LNVNFSFLYENVKLNREEERETEEEGNRNNIFHVIVRVPLCIS